MSTSDDILAIAASQVGTLESPPNSNCQKYSHDLGRPCEAWCADSVVWIERQGGIHLPSESAYTPAMYNGFVLAGTAITDLAHGLHPGDVLFFDFVPPFNTHGIQHVGIFKAYGAPGHIETYEGNTSSGDGGSQDNGGGYFHRIRPLSFIVGAGRPPYANHPPVTPPAPVVIGAQFVPALALNIVASAKTVDGRVYLAQADGSIFGFEVPGIRGANGQDYFANRKVAHIFNNSQPEVPAHARGNGDGLAISIQTESNEWYGPYSA